VNHVRRPSQPGQDLGADDGVGALDLVVDGPADVVEEGDLARLDPRLASPDGYALWPEAAPPAAVALPPKVRLPGRPASDEPIVLDEEDR